MGFEAINNEEYATPTEQLKSSQETAEEICKEFDLLDLSSVGDNKNSLEEKLVLVTEFVDKYFTISAMMAGRNVRQFLIMNTKDNEQAIEEKDSSYPMRIPNDIANDLAKIESAIRSFMSKCKNAGVDVEALEFTLEEEQKDN